mmetsp:Transcript_2451/g.3862  ORF Transcript_2451/g.3862 Transcript_2451/m.3862 type:complete len:206 (-) Transcript_2451:42-659(-)
MQRRQATPTNQKEADPPKREKPNRRSSHQRHQQQQQQRRRCHCHPRCRQHSRWFKRRPTREDDEVIILVGETTKAIPTRDNPYSCTANRLPSIVKNPARVAWGSERKNLPRILLFSVMAVTVNFTWIVACPHWNKSQRGRTIVWIATSKVRRPVWKNTLHVIMKSAPMPRAAVALSCNCSKIDASYQMRKTRVVVPTTMRMMRMT